MAGNLQNLTDVENAPNYVFEKGDITDEQAMYGLFEKYSFDGVVHLARRAMLTALLLLRPLPLSTQRVRHGDTRIACKKYWKGNSRESCSIRKHVSTDEVTVLGEE
jgi:dTDP-glucose 4,6-dehydratase